jgi:hypothetical protein
MSPGLGEVGEGSPCAVKAEIPDRKGQYSRAAASSRSRPMDRPSILNRPAAPALQPSIALSDAAWCACGRSDLLDLDAIGRGYSVSVAQRGSGVDSTGEPCVYFWFCRAWSVVGSMQHARQRCVELEGSSQSHAHGSSTPRRICVPCRPRPGRPVLLPTHPGPTARHLRVRRSGLRFGLQSRERRPHGVRI